MTDTWVILPRQDDSVVGSYRLHEDKNNRHTQMEERSAQGTASAWALPESAHPPR
jgi:hypothetical protein